MTDVKVLTAHGYKVYSKVEPDDSSRLLRFNNFESIKNLGMKKNEKKTLKLNFCVYTDLI